MQMFIQAGSENGLWERALGTGSNDAPLIALSVALKLSNPKTGTSVVEWPSKPFVFPS